jgi:hypothetical protein
MKKVPLLATGEVVENYEPLFFYWKKARERGREDLIESTLIKEEDLNLLRRIVEERNALNLEELINVLVREFSNRIDAELARDALRDYGLEMTENEARDYIARIFAGWVIEAGILRRIVNIRKSWSV